MVAAAAGFAALACVGLLGWRRTRDMRTGRDILVAPDAAAPAERSSRTTWLAAGIAAAVGLATVVTLVADEPVPRPVAWTALAWSAFALASGLRARVIEVSATESRVEIRYAARQPFSSAWSDVTGIVPPRWPMGCWRLTTVATRRTLMPSDLLGAENVLRESIVRAGLRFDGRAWSRTPARGS